MNKKQLLWLGLIIWLAHAGLYSFIASQDGYEVANFFMIVWCILWLMAFIAVGSIYLYERLGD